MLQISFQNGFSLSSQLGWMSFVTNFQFRGVFTEIVDKTIFSYLDLCYLMENMFFSFLSHLSFEIIFQFSLFLTILPEYEIEYDFNDPRFT